MILGQMLNATIFEEQIGIGGMRQNFIVDDISSISKELYGDDRPKNSNTNIFPK